MLKTSARKALFVLVALASAFGGALAAQSSNRPDQRRLGEEVLMEALLGPRHLLVRVASGGCTGKESFKVEAQKAPASTPEGVHYVLTIDRIKVDSCKAFLPDGEIVAFDLEADLGLKGAFTYALSNRVVSIPSSSVSENSLFGIIKKYFTVR
jgi:hypothetical protein